MRVAGTRQAAAGILGWPGKSARSPGLPEHPAVYHMLDVAAVAERLLARFAFPPALRDALVLLAALHDLGKINENFLRMLRSGVAQSARHWQVTELLLLEHDDLLRARLGSHGQRRRMLYAATAGHHGRPPGLTGNDEKRAMRQAGAAAIADARSVVETFLDLWPGASLADLGRDEARVLSWWLPGLVSAADWIGSDPTWFAAVEAGPSPADYLAAARGKAARAVIEAGLAGAAPADRPLFDVALRPMQAACAAIDLPAGPMLAVIEDETGAGKTEAALILAQRMMLAGKGHGLYFALPTMATADAMFLRMAGVVGRMFAERPTVTLAHGRSGLSVPFRDLVAGSPEAPEDAGCTTWLAEGRRRALLGDVGIGTIDQALLSVMPTRFQTLRHFALSSKILIVDEAHELGEPYLKTVMEELLRLHRMAGGSAILLTATLPLEQRARLMAHYTDDPSGDPAYPALTIAGGAAHRDLPRETGARGLVRVERLPDADAAVRLLKQASQQGAACVWVRNAVDDAIAAVEALRAAGVEADLLHARFALCDRKRIEAEALARFGKTGDGRSGRVLVATQVVEASLDLDFDVMVSDLAPMAALIQRLGRLWRHMAQRPRTGRPVPEPVLHVVSPDPALVEDDRWLSRVLERGAFVYPLDLQWRTADHLFRVGRIEAPAGLRGLIEAVHGAQLAPVPAALAARAMEDAGKGMAAAAQGWQNVVDLDRDFRSGGGADDDAGYPTRLGEPQSTLVLARMAGGRMVPWADGEGPEAWALSEVCASLKRLARLTLPDQSAPAIAAITAQWPHWKRATTRLCPVAADGAICEGLLYDGKTGLVFASS